MQPPLLLSCKLTNAALKFLERRGEDLEPLYERFDWPLHYLRDSSSWLEADRLEFVLVTLEELYGARILNETGRSFFEVVGHSSPQLRAWGALDSVIRIVPGVRELYQQPDRFLASFISPQPTIRGLSHYSHHGTERTEFRFEFSDNRMPRTALYLRSILESLPEYIGKPRSAVTWTDGAVTVDWSERQVPFVALPNLGVHDSAPSLSPELLRTILVDLANAQRELESTRRILSDKDIEIQNLKTLANASHAQTLGASSALSKDGMLNVINKNSENQEKRMKLALHEIYKLGDYFARAQQMVTVLRSPSATSGLSKINAEAMVRRTAWDRVAKEAPDSIRRAAAYLQMDLGQIELEQIELEQIDSETPIVSSTPNSATRAGTDSPSESSTNFPDQRSGIAKIKAPSFFDTINNQS